MDDRTNARLDMIEPGRFFVLCETLNGGVTGRAYTSVAEALAEFRSVTDRDGRGNTVQPIELAA